MNPPMSTHLIGQATHREYEAKFGQHTAQLEDRQAETRRVGRSRLALALGSLTGVILLISYLV